VSRARRAAAAVEAADGPWLEPGDEEGTRLLLFAVPTPELLASGCLAAMVLPATAIDDEVRALRLQHRLPLLVRGEPSAAVELDGAHLAAPELVARTRQTLGRDALIGVDCGLSRHAAMVAGEAGADYVLFGSLDLAPPGAVTDLVVWWRELFVLPCAAAGRFSPETAGALADAGAELLATSEADASLVQAIRIHGSH
jgi:thiamine-phosphate pyrophosphorylase